MQYMINLIIFQLIKKKKKLLKKNLIHNYLIMKIILIMKHLIGLLKNKKVLEFKLIQYYLDLPVTHNFFKFNFNIFFKIKIIIIVIIKKCLLNIFRILILIHLKLFEFQEIVIKKY